MAANIALEITADDRKALDSIRKMQKELRAVQYQQEKNNKEAKKKQGILRNSTDELKGMARQYLSIATAAGTVLKVWNDIVNKQKESMSLNRSDEQAYRSLAQIASGATQAQRQQSFAGLRANAQSLAIRSGRGVSEAVDAIFQLQSTGNLSPESIAAVSKFGSISGSGESLGQIATSVGTIQGTYRGRTMSTEDILGTLLAGSAGGKFTAAQVSEAMAKSGGAMSDIGASAEELASIIGFDTAAASPDIASEGLRAFAQEVAKKYPQLVGGTAGETYRNVKKMLAQKGMSATAGLDAASARGYKTMSAFFESGQQVVSGADVLNRQFGALDPRAMLNLENEQMRQAANIAKAQTADIGQERAQIQNDLNYYTGESNIIRHSVNEWLNPFGMGIELDIADSANVRAGAAGKGTDFAVVNELQQIKQEIKQSNVSNSLGTSQGEGGR